MLMTFGLSALALVAAAAAYDYLFMKEQMITTLMAGQKIENGLTSYTFTEYNEDPEMYLSIFGFRFAEVFTLKDATPWGEDLGLTPDSLIAFVVKKGALTGITYKKRLFADRDQKIFQYCKEAKGFA